MSHEIRADYSQQMLFPPSLEDLLPANHPARFVREFVDSLNLREMGFKVQQGEEGRPCYAADMLLKVWVYGYLEKIRSTRKLEKACRDHVGLMWLTGMHYPDHNALWRFWRDNRKVIGEVFRQTVQLALKLELVDIVLNAVDGTKIAAQGSNRAMWNKQGLEQKLKRIEAELNQAMEEVEQAERKDTGEYTLPQELKDKEVLREKIREKLTELQKEGRERMHPQEPDAQIMKMPVGKGLAYNAQVVANGKAGIIVAADVTKDHTDKGQLVPMLEAAQKMTGNSVAETVADAGYFSGEQLAKAQERKLSVLVSLKELEAEAARGGDFSVWKFQYDGERNCCICPQGEKLVYKGLVKHKAKTYSAHRYHCQSFAQCPVRWECSKSARGRQVEINPNHDAILEQRAKHNVEANKQQLKQRAGIVEPVFAWAKHLLGFRRWTLRGLEKVRQQWAFVCAVVNLNKIYHKWAVLLP